MCAGAVRRHQRGRESCLLSSLILTGEEKHAQYETADGTTAPSSLKWPKRHPSIALITPHPKSPPLLALCTFTWQVSSAPSTCLLAYTSCLCSCGFLCPESSFFLGTQLIPIASSYSSSLPLGHSTVHPTMESSHVEVRWVCCGLMGWGLLLSVAMLRDGGTFKGWGLAGGL